MFRSAMALVMTAILAAAFPISAGAQEPADAGPLSLFNEQYKRIHQSALRIMLEQPIRAPSFEVPEGDPIEIAIDALGRLETELPGDPDTPFMLACAHTMQGDLDKAIEYVRQSVERGLPIERYIAGPRSLLEPLIEHPAFQAFAEGRVSKLVHGPLAGSVTDRSARIWVRTADEMPVQVMYSASPEGQPAEDGTQVWRVTEPVRSSREMDYTAVVTIDGLEPNTRYYYRVVIDAEGGRIVPDTAENEPAGAGVHSFRTFAEPGTPARFEAIFGGGAGYTPAHERMWDVIHSKRPHALLLLGDNIYPDAPESPEIQRFSYYRRQSQPGYRRVVANTPVFSIWDDHDFGWNDSWGGPEVDDPAWKPEVWQIFRENWNNPGYGGGAGQPGIWYNFSIGDVDFFMLDCRYYRTDPSADVLTMLGPVQKQWFLDTLARSTATFKVLCSSVPWTRGTKGGSPDTWDGYLDERNEIFDFIEERKIDGVLLLAADRHRSDAMLADREVGYPLYEFMSSRLTNVHRHDTLDWALFSYNDKQSFGRLTFDTTVADPTVTYDIFTIDDEMVYTLTVRKSQLTPATE